ncbi:MAG TPA: hypothetical protein VIW01_12305 [Dehalococcoidia bacterium]
MRFSRLLVIAIVSGLALLVGPTPVAYGATFTVDSTADSPDFSTADGVCDTDNGAGDGPCTLRAAIQQANFSAGTDTIGFSIAGAGPHTISPGSALPTITGAVIIDGTTEPDFVGTPVVELNGAGAGAGVDGLRIAAGSSTVKGLVINRFGGDGIELNTVGGNTIVGNYIGTDVSGSADLGNGGSGLYVLGVQTSTVGGTAAGAGNVISGNGAAGVFLAGSGASGSTIRGNYIGTDASGTASLGNTGVGVYLGGAPNNTIGGTAAGARNVISANATGVSIASNTATGNTLLGNYIGTDVSGAVDLGNVAEGVAISGAPDNTVGGTSAAARNIISGNGGNGVSIAGAASGNKIRGNNIGTDLTGTLSLGNTSNGIYIWNGASNNTIGGALAGSGNTIAFNGGDGVHVVSGSGNLIDPNSIQANGGLGIDLGVDGVDTNDALDADAGANDLQNHPVLTSALISGGNTIVKGTLSSTVSTSFTLEFFSNASCDGSGNGEGEEFEASSVQSTDGSGSVSFTVFVGSVVPAGRYITATATNPSNSTSEFSACEGILADADGDGLPDDTDPCPDDTDNDSDGDGICNGSSFQAPKTGGDDNCPSVANPSQANADGDPFGDACETVDCVNQFTPWVTPAGDVECDGYISGDASSGEVFIGTDPSDACADTTATYDERGPAFGEPLSPWPPDVNDDRKVSLSDFLAFAPWFLKFDPDPAYNPRFDFNASGGVTLSDALSIGPYFLKFCDAYFNPLP